MIARFTLSQTLATVPGLSRSYLSAFVKAGLVAPAPSAQGPEFGPADLARLELLCELTRTFGLQRDGLAVVIGLIDQLHDTRRHLHAMAEAVHVEPSALRHRIRARYLKIVSA